MAGNERGTESISTFLKAAVDIFWIDQYSHRGVAPQAEDQEEMTSSGTLPSIHASLDLLTIHRISKKRCSWQS